MFSNIAAFPVREKGKEEEGRRERRGKERKGEKEREGQEDRGE